MPNEISTKPSKNELRRLVDTLACASGLTLTPIDDSISFDGQNVAITAMSRDTAKNHAIALKAIAKVFISEPHEGKTTTWALIFFYIDGLRVTAEGRSHVAFSADNDGEWKKLGWESDEYKEWEEMSDAAP